MECKAFLSTSTGLAPMKLTLAGDSEEVEDSEYLAHIL